MFWKVTSALTLILSAGAPVREGALPVAPPTPGVVLDAMQAELDRSMRELKMKGQDAPYFVSYQAIDHDVREIDAHYGALFADDDHRDRRLYVDVRVGSYQLDSSGIDPSTDIDLSAPDPGYSVRREAPLDPDPGALRNALWLLTDEKYKQALSTYLKKKAKGVYAVEDEDHTPSFSREPASHHEEPITPVAFDADHWKAVAKRLSEEFKQHAEVFDSDVKIDADQQARYFVSSEGSRLDTQATIFAVHLDAVARAVDGQLLENTRDFYAPTEAQLPTEASLEASTASLIEELAALKQAPVIDPYTGPAILAPEATGVLFHEAVGHRLEGERQDDDSEGRTFKGQVGNRVLPAFLTVVDDPTVKAIDGVSLNGTYDFDEEGIGASRTPLVEKGILKNFILSRHMIKGFLHSNGHGRAAGSRAPEARMANLLVTSDAGHAKSWAALKTMLIEEARKQGKPYGLIIKDMSGGNTNTSGYGYQAFKGQPRLVYRVDVKTGKEELVRGVEMVGTPLTVINKIVAMGDHPGVFNGYCGAESGFVPVSTVAPAALISEIELQRTTKTNQKPPLLPSPWTGKN